MSLEHFKALRTAFVAPITRHSRNQASSYPLRRWLWTLVSLAAAPAVGWSGTLDAFASCEVNTTITVASCIQVSGGAVPYVPPTTMSDSVAAGIGEATYSVRADYGNLGLYLNAATQASSGQISTSATATGSATFFDSVLVSSTNLSDGAPVTATAWFTIDGSARAQATSIVGEVTSSADSYLRANYSIYDSAGPLVAFIACSASSPAFGACSDVYDTDGMSYQFSFETYVGAVLTVQGELSGSADARVGANEAAGAFPRNYATVSALNSSHTYFSAEAAQFVGDAGHNYAAPAPVTAVPEPATSALLLFGLGALGGLRRVRAFWK